MTNDTLKDPYLDELKDIYSAENQMLKALPKLAKAASSEDLRAAFEEHLEQTKGQVRRLDKVFKMLGESPKGEKCHGMEGPLEEGSEAIEEYENHVLDAALISAAQRVEHYEMAAYGTVRTYAELLGETEHASLLEETLQEEKDADQKLTQLSKRINVDADKEDERASIVKEQGKRKSAA